MKPLISFILLFACIIQNSDAYTFRLQNEKPDKWNDAEVESFLFLSQIQNKTGLNKNSNLCISVSQPVYGGVQSMRIVSKITNNKGTTDATDKNGMFEVGKAEVTEQSAKADVDAIKQIVNLSAGYQQGILNNSTADAAPTALSQSDLKQYMSAEVIGYTDGLGVANTVSAIDGTATKWTSTSGKSYSTNYTSNEQLGMLRSIYLTEQLGLKDSFGYVAQSSKTSEKELKDYDKDVQKCSTRRTAEVRMNFQTGAKVGDNSKWVMPTQMMPEETHRALQLEAGLQMQTALKSLNDDILFDEVPAPSPSPSPSPATKTTSKTTTVKTEPLPNVKVMTPEYITLCKSILSAIWTSATGTDKCKFTETKNIKLENTSQCRFSCGGEIGDIYVNTGNGPYGGDFTAPRSQNNITIVPPQGKEEYRYKANIYKGISESSGVKTAFENLNKIRKEKRDAHLMAKFPNCDKTEYKSDLLTLADQVSGVASTNYERSLLTTGGSIDYKKAGEDHVLVTASYVKSNDGGRSGRLLRCLDMTRAMKEVYNSSATVCRPGKEFTSVTFPHKDANLGCRYCRFGWSTDKSGNATFRERSYSALAETDSKKVRKYDPHDAHSTLDKPTFEALQAPGVHEISNCANCQCGDKNKKLNKIYQVEQASENSLVPTVDATACYCATPVVPSCAVGPGGYVDGDQIVQLSQKYFYDACAGKFEKVTGDSKGVQIQNLLNQFNKGCATDPSKCGAVDIKKAVESVNAMMCESQNYRLPSDDPVADCTKEDGVVAQ